MEEKRDHRVVLVTGSEDFDNDGAVAQEILNSWAKAGRPPTALYTLDREAGADHVAATVINKRAEGFSHFVVTSPEEAAALDVDEAFFFIRNASPGASSLFRVATKLKKRGVPVTVYVKDVYRPRGRRRK